MQNQAIGNNYIKIDVSHSFNRNDQKAAVMQALSVALQDVIL